MSVHGTGLFQAIRRNDHDNKSHGTEAIIALIHVLSLTGTARRMW